MLWVHQLLGMLVAVAPVVADALVRSSSLAVAVTDVPAERALSIRAGAREATVEARPDGTAIAYGDHDCTNGCKREWREWCEAPAGTVLHGVELDSEKPVYDTLVTPEKVEDYLQNYLGVRELMNAQRKTLGAGTSLGASQLKKHVSALNDLYKSQRSDVSTSEVMQNIGKPRSSETVGEIMKTARNKTSARAAAMYLERGAGSNLMEGYTPAQHAQLAAFGVIDGAPGPSRSRYFQGARFHLSHVLRHVLAFRGDSLRKLQLADFCIVVAPDDEGPHRCPLLVVVHNNGKNNPEGRVDTSAAMRHADDPTMCLHFAVALWLFMLFVVEQTPLPVEEFIGFDRGGVHTRPWFDAFILPGNQKSGKRGKTGPLCLKEEFSDRTMNTETKNAYARIAHPVEDTHHTVHLNRGVALRAAEDRGVPEGQLRRAACHRGTDALNQSYLTGYPYDFIRIMAGFSRSRGSFFLMRGIAVPNARLVAEVYLVILGPLSAAMDTPTFPKERVGGATRGWVEVLEHLAVVLIQDLAVLHPKMKKHPVFGVAPFNDNTFGFFDFMDASKKAAQDAPAAGLQCTAEAAAERGDEHCANFAREVLAGALAIRHGADGATRAAVASSAMTLAESPMRKIREVHEAVVGNGALRLHEGPGTRRVLDLAEEADVTETANVVASDPSTWPTGAQAGAARALPLFVRAFTFPKILNVHDAHRAYFQGTSGAPAIRDLDAHYGASIRTGSAAKGWSWHSQHERNDNRALEKKLTKFRAIFSYLLEKGEGATALLQGKIDANFPGQPPTVAQITWLNKTLREETPEFEKNRQRAIAGAKKRQKISPQSEAAADK